MQRYKLSYDVKGEIYYSPDNAKELLQGKYYLGDVLEILRHLTPEYRGKVQLIYMDPPFLTGQEFKFRQPIGIKGWSGDREHSISHIAYTDKVDKDILLNMMTEVLTLAYELLTDEGCLYLHIDYRLSAYMRIILDDIFGIDNFLNEIIWHYRTGGRAKRHFSRKHDNILFYRKSKGYYFNIEAVGIPRGTDKKNNMKQGKDANGRVFWSIKSGGREYRYYEDDKVYPSDVWDDIPHLHQQNPERTGYDTQKPERLLERIVLSSSRPGDIVADLFAGSGTTLNVAQRLGRRWLGIDSSIFSLHTCRKRLLNNERSNKIGFFYNENIPALSIKQGNHNEITICDFEEDIELIDHWSIGYVKNGVYNSIKHSMRTSSNPNLDIEFQLNEKAIENFSADNLCIHTVDIYGKQRFYIAKTSP
ncbi:MAG: site-specific DNA-methyltransferase [Clostridiales bacterium]|nr:site-specific DNA-methyltransferase [Clostridiales bacterium]